MTRWIRLIVPVSLCGLITSAVVLACSHHKKEAPATPGPEATSPSGEPAPTPPSAQPAPPPSDAGGSGMVDAGVDGYPPPSGPRAALERSLGGAGVPVELASQPVTPQGPTGAPPTPGAPAPNPPSPSPGAPSPTPSTPPPTPGLPPVPTGPSQPGGATPAPGMPTSGTPSQAPGDAGVGDALTPPVPPISDAGVHIDSGLSPVLQRDD